MVDLVDIAPMLNPMPDQLPTHLTGEHAAQQLELLRERMEERDVTVEEAWDYIALRHQPDAGMQMQPLARFITPADLQSFWWLHDWWAPVVDKPNTLPTPALAHFFWFVNYLPPAQPLSFDDAMRQFHTRATQYCVSVGIDPERPGETKEERRKRLNRDRMAKVRGHLPVPDSLLKGDETLAAHVRGLEAQCDTLKAEGKVEDERLRIAVVGFQTSMMEASSHRKTTAQTYKDRIEQLRTEIRTLTAKQ